MSASENPLGDQSEGGFTLVEVLIAFCIAALTLITAFRVLGQGATLAHRGPQAALQFEEATSLVDTVIADPHLVPGLRQGVFADGQPWQVRITDVSSTLALHGAGRLLRVAMSGPQVSQPPLLVTLVASETKP